jgi:hypothetical protein
MPNTFEGGCLCGSIHYASTSDPLGTMYCHCRDCQIVSGGAHSTVVLVPTASLAITKGLPKAYESQGESGNTVVRNFCTECGTHLYSELSAEIGMVAVKAGTLDDPSWLTPSMNIWTSSAQPWAHIDETLMKADKNPAG